MLDVPIVLTLGDALRVKFPRRGGHRLYRLYAHSGDLLYIGITCLPLAERFGQHRRQKSWWEQVTHVSLTDCANETHALEKERDAIRSEMPRFNIRSRNLTAPDRSRNGSIHDPFRNGSGIVLHLLRPSRTRAEQGAGSREVGAGMNVATAIHSQVSAHERMDGVNRCR